MISKNRNNKAVILNSSVMTEKCSKKDFILNSETFLNNVGIAFYFWTGERAKAGGQILGSVDKNLDEIIEIFGEDNLSNIYYTITSNPKLKLLPYRQFDLKKISKHNACYLLRDGHHDKYSGNNLRDISGDNHTFVAYCMSKKIRETTGYSDKNIHF